MKNLITILIMLVVAGCATTPTMKSIVGTYEVRDRYSPEALKFFLLENGKVYFVEEETEPNPLRGEGTWKIVGEEVHVAGDYFPVLSLTLMAARHLNYPLTIWKRVAETGIFKIEPNSDLTWIATIRWRDLSRKGDGERIGVLQEITLKKIK